MNVEHRDGHSDEGDLIRFLDDQTDLTDRPNVRDHLAVCEECSLAFDELRHASVTLRRELARDKIATPSHFPTDRLSRNKTPVWRVAAGIVLLLAATSAFQPVRAWMATGWQTVVGLFVGDNTTEASDSTALVDTTRTGAVISFLPRTERLFIDVTTWQSVGELMIVTVDDQNVSAQVLSSDAPEHIAIVPSGGVSIANTSSSVSNYRITVPRSLEQVTIRVAGASILSFAPSADQEPKTISLEAG